GVGGGDDDLLALGNQLVHIQRHITGSRGQVEKHVVELVPMDFGEEVAKHFAQHRTPPDHRSVVPDEEGHRHHLHPEPLDGQNRLVDHDGTLLDSHHVGHAETVDIGIDDSHFFPFPGHRDRQIDGDGGLADPTLAAGDGDKLSFGILGQQRREGSAGFGRGTCPRALLPQSGRQSGALLIRHRTEADIYLLRAQGTDRLLHVVLNLHLERTTLYGQNDVQRHPGAVDPDVANHAELHQAHAQLRILHSPEGIQNLFLREHREHPIIISVLSVYYIILSGVHFRRNLLLAVKPQNSEIYRRGQLLLILLVTQPGRLLRIGQKSHLHHGRRHR